jgi:hypothetical protein
MWKSLHPTVEALQLHSNTQSHWSSGSTVCFLSRGADSLCPGDAPTLTMEPGSPATLSLPRHSGKSVYRASWKQSGLFWKGTGELLGNFLETLHFSFTTCQRFSIILSVSFSVCLQICFYWLHKNEKSARRSCQPIKDKEKTRANNSWRMRGVLSPKSNKLIFCCSKSKNTLHFNST